MLDAESTANRCREVSPKRVTDTSRPIGGWAELGRVAPMSGRPRSARGTIKSRTASQLNATTHSGFPRVKPTNTAMNRTERKSPEDTEKPALARAKRGRMRKPTHECRVISSRSTGDRVSRAAISAIWSVWQSSEGVPGQRKTPSPRAPRGAYTTELDPCRCRAPTLIVISAMGVGRRASRVAARYGAIPDGSLVRPSNQSAPLTVSGCILAPGWGAAVSRRTVSMGLAWKGKSGVRTASSGSAKGK